MSYTVLARKYRSRTLAEVVGQEPIVTTLTNAIRSDRIHHGYLFCGTRGVGKTSTARILAKSLNCLAVEEPTAEPCLECDACRAISEGEDLDVVEVDAASNTGVDNIRELRENAHYRPAHSRFKIYIIDEVHMLSAGAFNALLKTLEEPPEHVKFVMATTEQQKVPATIQSRVQRFEFQSIPVDLITKHLRCILEQEGIEAEDDLLRRVARSARGSMRDALSLLDQVLSCGATKLNAAMLDELLPHGHDEVMAELITALIAADPARALVEADRYLERGRTLEQFCESFLEHARTLMILNLCGRGTALVDVPAQLLDQVAGQAATLEPSGVVYMISVVEGLRRHIRLGGAGRALVDAAVVRLASTAQFSALPEVLQAVESAPACGVSAASAAVKKKLTSEPLRASEAVSSQQQSATAGQPRGSAVAPNKSRRQTQRPAAQPEQRYAQATVSREELERVRSDPLVRGALDVFQGTLMNVQRLQAPTPEVMEQENSD